jgi:hypothetical protein
MEAKVSKQNLPYFLALMNLQIRHSISGGNILLLLRLCFVLFHNHFLSAANRVMARRNNACHILLYYPLNSTPLSLSFPPTALLKDAPNFSLSGIVFGLPETHSESQPGTRTTPAAPLGASSFNFKSLTVTQLEAVKSLRPAIP